MKNELKKNISKYLFNLAVFAKWVVTCNYWFLKNCCVLLWYLNLMVTLNMLLMYEGKYVSSEKKNPN